QASTLGRVCLLSMVTLITVFFGTQAAAQTFIATVGEGLHYVTDTCGGPGPGTPLAMGGTQTLVNDSTPLWKARNVSKLALIKIGTQWLPGSVTVKGMPDNRIPGPGGSDFTSTVTAVGIVTTQEVGRYTITVSSVAITVLVETTETLDLNTGQYTWCS